MTVIVTDHHDVPFADQPDGRRVFLQSAADAVVNPKQADCAYPFKVLCGAGVAATSSCIFCYSPRLWGSGRGCQK